MIANDHLKIYKLNDLTYKTVQYVVFDVLGAEQFNYGIREVIWAIFNLHIKDSCQIPLIYI